MINFRFLSVVVLCALLSLSSARAAVGIDQAAPPLQAQELNGGAFDLTQLRGKVVVVNFWATWCEPCKIEMPVFNRFYQAYKGANFAMLAISVDRAKDHDAVIKAMKAYSFPAATIDQVSTNGFGLPSSVPITYIIDANGIIRAQLTPATDTLTDHILDRILLPLLSY